MRKRKDAKLKLARKLLNPLEAKKKGWGPFNGSTWRRRADSKAQKEALKRERAHMRREERRLAKAKAHSALLREHKMTK